MNNYNKKEIIYYDNGTIKQVTYTRNRFAHREDGPAFKRYNEDGVLLEEKHYYKGKLHSFAGPSHVIYEEKEGKAVPKQKLYYCHGDLVGEE